MSVVNKELKESIQLLNVASVAGDHVPVARVAGLEVPAAENLARIMQRRPDRHQRCRCKTTRPQHGRKSAAEPIEKRSRDLSLSFFDHSGRDGGSKEASMKLKATATARRHAKTYLPCLSPQPLPGPGKGSPPRRPRSPPQRPPSSPSPDQVHDACPWRYVSSYLLPRRRRRGELARRAGSGRWKRCAAASFCDEDRGCELRSGNRCGKCGSLPACSSGGGDHCGRGDASGVVLGASHAVPAGGRQAARLCLSGRRWHTPLLGFGYRWPGRERPARRPLES